MHKPAHQKIQRALINNYNKDSTDVWRERERSDISEDFHII